LSQLSDRARRRFCAQRFDASCKLGLAVTIDAVVRADALEVRAVRHHLARREVVDQYVATRGSGRAAMISERSTTSCAIVSPVAAFENSTS
jgi:hypothetical protein